MADIGRRFFKLITNEVVFGDCETVLTESGVTEILIKKPYTAKNGNIMPYMVDVMTSAPAAIQLHPMNIIWTVPLDEFAEANKVYVQATTGIILDAQPNIIV